VTIRIDRVEPDVVRLALSTWQGRAAGYDVSAYMMRGVLIDTGFPAVRRELLHAVQALAPRGAVVTHWHEDHSGNAPDLADIGLALRMHDKCETSLRARPSIGLYRRVIWGRPRPLRASLKEFDLSPLEVISTPGHTEDHLVVWDAERRIVASGDLFLGVKVRVAHAHEHPTTLIQSLRAVAALEPRLLLDAHRGIVTQPVDLLRAKIAWMEEMIDDVRTLATRGADAREIQRRVLGAEAVVGRVSLGEYSKIAMVRAVLQEMAALTE
jgi:glyoxylase-like metal-dependent hydrolase (beta-lactamase superfamily II)